MYMLQACDIHDTHCLYFFLPLHTLAHTHPPLHTGVPRTPHGPHYHTHVYTRTHAHTLSHCAPRLPRRAVTPSCRAAHALPHYTAPAASIPVTRAYHLHCACRAACRARLFCRLVCLAARCALWTFRRARNALLPAWVHRTRHAAHCAAHAALRRARTLCAPRRCALRAAPHAAPAFLCLSALPPCTHYTPRTPRTHTRTHARTARAAHVTRGSTRWFPTRLPHHTHTYLHCHVTYWFHTRSLHRITRTHALHTTTRTHTAAPAPPHTPHTRTHTAFLN